MFMTPTAIYKRRYELEDKNKENTPIIPKNEFMDKEEIDKISNRQIIS